MIKIAIVEDESAAAEELKVHLKRFEGESGEKFEIFEFRDGLAFLDGYKPDYDIVFMDIQMPGISGMETAARLRAADKRVYLVFITNMAQYAIRGYEVDACDFVLKPVGYYRMQTLLSKILSALAQRTERTVSIRSGHGLIRLDVASIAYVEVQDHKLFFVTGGDNGCVESWGTLTEAKKMLYEDCFVKCSNSALVNLRFVQSVRRDEIVVAGKTFFLTRGCKGAFLSALTDYKGC